MKLSHALLLIPFSLATLPVGGCVTSNHKSDGLNQVDDLLGRIERLYVECELAEARVRDAVESMQYLTAAEPSGDPAQLHLALAVAVERAQEQALALHASIDPMKTSGEALFARWNSDLEAFRSESMRTRSQARLTETRARYDAIVDLVEPTVVEIDELNGVLSDAVLFLSNDLNPASLAALQPDVQTWSEQALGLREQLESCMEVAEEYMRSSAMPEGPQAAAGPTSSVAVSG